MRVIAFGTYDTTRHPRVAVVLEGLRAAGDVVVEVNEPLPLSTADRVAILQQPWKLYRLVALLVRSWWRLAVRTLPFRRVRRNVDAVIVGYMGHFDVLLARLLFPRTTIVLDQMIFAADTARDRGVTGGLKLRLLDALDHLAVRAASVVLVDTTEHATLLSAGQRHKAVVVPVGATPEWLPSTVIPDRGDTSPLRVIFYGLFTPLQGATVLGEALALLKDRDDIQVTVAGSGQDASATKSLASANGNVTWQSWIEAAQLPAVVAEHDVCLGIFGTTPKAMRVVPNKVYQGAAAGCCVVTSDTPPQRALFGDALRYVRAGDAAALAAELVTLADDRALVRAHATSSLRVAQTTLVPAILVQQLRTRLAEGR